MACHWEFDDCVELLATDHSGQNAEEDGNVSQDNENDANNSSLALVIQSEQLTHNNYHYDINTYIAVQCIAGRDGDPFWLGKIV